MVLLRQGTYDSARANSMWMISVNRRWDFLLTWYQIHIKSNSSLSLYLKKTKLPDFIKTSNFYISLLTSQKLHNDTIICDSCVLPVKNNNNFIFGFRKIIAQEFNDSSFNNPRWPQVGGREWWIVWHISCGLSGYKVYSFQILFHNKTRAAISYFLVSKLLWQIIHLQTFL